MGGVIGIVMRC